MQKHFYYFYFLCEKQGGFMKVAHAVRNSEMFRR